MSIELEQLKKENEALKQAYSELSLKYTKLLGVLEEGLDKWWEDMDKDKLYIASRELNSNEEFCENCLGTGEVTITGNHPRTNELKSMTCPECFGEGVVILPRG